jgi:hypothetical protein
MAVADDALLVATSAGRLVVHDLLSGALRLLSATEAPAMTTALVVLPGGAQAALAAGGEVLEGYGASGMGAQAQCDALTLQLLG